MDKPTHGGARQGAGRHPKPVDKKLIRVSFTIRLDQKQALDAVEVESASSIVRQLIDQWLKSNS